MIPKQPNERKIFTGLGIVTLGFMTVGNSITAAMIMVILGSAIILAGDKEL